MTSKEFVEMIKKSVLNIDSTNFTITAKLSPEDMVKCIKYLMYESDEDLNISDEVIKYRAEHRMTQTQFANLVGVTTPIIVNVEKGRGCSQTTVKKIKRAII